MDIQIRISTPDAKTQAIENIMSRDKQAQASPVAPDKKIKGDVNYREAMSSKFINIELYDLRKLDSPSRGYAAHLPLSCGNG